MYFPFPLGLILKMFMGSEYYVQVVSLKVVNWYKLLKICVSPLMTAIQN
jgi:hypothetical protein